ncbi:MAG: hydrolase [Thermodesulfobacteriota bacterium]
MVDYATHLDWIKGQKDHMVSLVERWAAVNSGSRNITGLNALLDLLSDDFSALGGEMRSLSLPPQTMVDGRGEPTEVPLGKALSIVKRPSASLKVFLGIHYDTVFEAEHPFQECSRIDGDRLKGPGVADAKGGLAVMLTALVALERSPWAESIGWEIFINPDEEIGSPGSAELLRAAAKRNHLALLFEPALPGGALVSARRGSGNFTVVVRGRAAHAGRNPGEGRNAIHLLSEFIVRLNAMHADRTGVTINVGWLGGGGPANVVPDFCQCRFNARVTSDADREIFDANLGALVDELNGRDGFSVRLWGDFARPPKPLDDATLRALKHFARCGEEIGLSVQWQPSGGASDGNILAAAGLTTVDSLGVRGQGIHTSEEYLFLDSLTERAQLAALFLLKLASGEIRWLEEVTDYTRVH